MGAGQGLVMAGAITLGVATGGAAFAAAGGASGGLNAAVFGGISGGFVGGFAGGSGSAWVQGASFADGLKAGVAGAVTGAILGGLTAGIGYGLGQALGGGSPTETALNQTCAQNPNYCASGPVLRGFEATMSDAAPASGGSIVSQVGASAGGWGAGASAMAGSGIGALGGTGLVAGNTASGGNSVRGSNSLLAQKLPTKSPLYGEESFGPSCQQFQDGWYCQDKIGGVTEGASPRTMKRGPWYPVQPEEYIDEEDVSEISKIKRKSPRCKRCPSQGGVRGSMLYYKSLLALSRGR
jgi:hypothetical protein